MSSPARTGRTPPRRPAPSAVPIRGRRATAAEPPAPPRTPPPASTTRASTGTTGGVSHTTGAIRLRSRGTGALRTGTVRTRLRTGQHRPVRSTPVRPELRLRAATGPVPAAGAGRARRAPFVLLVVALLVGTTLGVLVLNTAIAVDSLRATSLRVANEQRAKQVQRLQQQVITGDAPGELAARAAKDGLVPAGTPGHLVIGPDGTSVLRGTPSPAPTPPPSSPAGGPAPTTPTTTPAAPGPDAAGD